MALAFGLPVTEEAAKLTRVSPPLSAIASLNSDPVVANPTDGTAMSPDISVRFEGIHPRSKTQEIVQKFKILDSMAKPKTICGALNHALAVT
jgi:hypothetical protein